MTVVSWSRVPSYDIIGFYTLEASKERCAACWTSTSLLTLAQEHKNIECNMYMIVRVSLCVCVCVCVCAGVSVWVYTCVYWEARLAMGPIECF